MIISVCFGTFNRLEDLRKNCGEILKEADEYKLDIEILVADGGSNDGTVGWLKKSNDKRIRPILLGKRTGYSHFMNRCITASRGNVIVQWNDDAFMCEGGWRALAKACTNRSVGGFRFPHCSQDIKGASFDPKTSIWSLVNGRKVPIGNHLMCFGCYYRSALKKIGLYHPAIKFYHSDTEMVQRAFIMMGKTKFPWMPECKVYHAKRKKGRANKLGDAQSRKDESKMSQVLISVRRTRKIPKDVPRLRK